jgi:hypothetical protein
VRGRVRRGSAPFPPKKQADNAVETPPLGAHALPLAALHTHRAAYTAV